MRLRILVLAVVALAAAGGGFGVGRATTPASTASPPSRSLTTTSLPASTTTTTIPTTTTVPASPPSVPIGVFAAFWRLHTTALVIDRSGYGIMSWRTHATCGQDPPPCDIFSGNEIIDGGNATLSLTRTGPSVASGRVLTTTAPDDVPLGPFTARLDGARDLLFPSFPLFKSQPLCGPAADALPVAEQKAKGINCGA